MTAPGATKDIYFRPYFSIRSVYVEKRQTAAEQKWSLCSMELQIKKKVYNDINNLILLGFGQLSN